MTAIDISDYRIEREIREVSDEVLAAGPPPVPTLTGDFTLRVVDPDSADPELLAEWFARPHLAQTWEQVWPAERWRTDAAYKLAGDYVRPVIFSYRGRPAGYLELYRVARDEIARLYDVHPHDLGFHVATADLDLLGRGLISGFLREVTDGMFDADPACVRSALEPSADNAPMRRAATKHGWRLIGEYDVRPDRRIALHILDRPAPAAGTDLDPEDPS